MLLLAGVLGPLLVRNGKAGRVPVETGVVGEGPTLTTKACAAVPHEARQQRPARRRILPAVLLLLVLLVVMVVGCPRGMRCCPWVEWEREGWVP